MRRFFYAFVAALSFQSAATAQTPFTQGNLVITRVGDGLVTLSSKAAPIALLELTPTGTIVQTVELPFKDEQLTGSNKKITVQGSSSNDGNITISADGRFFIVTGYSCDTTVISPASTSGIHRVVGRISNDGTINTSTLLDIPNSVGNVRAATSNDGSSFWVIGSALGVRYVPLGNTGINNQNATLVSNTVTNLRTIQTFGGNLIIGTASGQVVRAGFLTGFPTTTGNAMQSLPGMPVDITVNSIYMTSLPGGPSGINTMYLADDGTAPTGIKKYSLGTNGQWVANGVIDVGGAYRGLTGTTNGSTVTLYAVKASTPLLRFTDISGYNTTVTTQTAPYDTIYKAPTNFGIRGVQVVVAGATLPIRLLSFNAARNEANQVNVWWNVSGDNDIKNYIVQRSTDNKKFEPIATVAAAGKSTYDFLDTKPLSQTTYYRVQFVANDGKLTYTNVVVVTPRKSVKFEVLPNPTQGVVVVSFPAVTTLGNLAVSNAEGKFLMNLTVKSGTTQTNVDLSAYPTGQYFITYTDDEGNKAVKTILKK